MKVETKPVEQRPEVVITLSWEEAVEFRNICGGISGPVDGPRRYTQELMGALDGIGCYPTPCSTHGFSGHWYVR